MLFLVVYVLTLPLKEMESEQDIALSSDLPRCMKAPTVEVMYICINHGGVPSQVRKREPFAKTHRFQRPWPPGTDQKQQVGKGFWCNSGSNIMSKYITATIEATVELFVHSKTFVVTKAVYCRKACLIVFLLLGRVQMKQLDHMLQC